jgi:hypothetical protein
MEVVRILSLDVSSKTGYAFATVISDKFVLESYGQIDPPIECPDLLYPSSHVEWAYLCFHEIERLIEEYKPTVLSIEETSKGSKNALSQKILEFIHFLLAKYIVETSIEAHYLLTGEWRSLVGAKMNKTEKDRNKYVRKYKKEHGTKLAKDEVGKITGLVTKKHVNVRLANDLFGLKLLIGENDTADAILLAYGLYLKDKKIKDQQKRVL